MKNALPLLLVLSICTPLLAQKPKPSPPNSSRKLVEAFSSQFYKDASPLNARKPKTSLPLIKLDTSKIGPHWKPQYSLSKDGTCLRIFFFPDNKHRLEYGQPSVYITSRPFKGNLKDAPALHDDAAALEFNVTRYLPQKWGRVKIKSLGLTLRSFMDVASGGADNEVIATEPFAYRTKNGKTYWVMVKTESGYHKTKGMNLQKSLDALVFP